MPKYELISERRIVGNFYEALEQGAASYVPTISFPITSDQDSEKIAWLGQSPVMREMKGGRKVVPLSEYSMEIVNKDFEATIQFTDKDRRRDKTGQIAIRMGELADRANMHWARLLSVLIENGASQIGYDGQYFFDTDHSVGKSGTLSNKISVTIANLPVTNKGSVTSPSGATMEQAILQSITQMHGFKDDQGEPLNETAMSFLVMVPVGLFRAALSATTAEVLDDNNTNVLVKSGNLNIKLVANARLTAASTFYTFRTDGRTKPFITQEEVPVEVSVKGENSDYYFDNRAIQIGTYASCNVGYGKWEQAVSTTLV